MIESVPGFSSINPFFIGKSLKSQYGKNKTKNMKGSILGFPSLHYSSMRKIIKSQHETVNQECEGVGPWISLYFVFLHEKNPKKPRVGPWISLYISLFHGKKPNKAKRIQRQCEKVL
jgi:hypothetical protein